MPILDANVILRYLLGDIPEQSAEAQKAVLSGAATTAEVLAEVVYVLAGVYHVERQTIAQTLEGFLHEISIFHKQALGYAFRLYGESTLDFVDCILAGYQHTENQPVLTFDRKLQKVLQNNPLSGQFHTDTNTGSDESI